MISMIFYANNEKQDNAVKFANKNNVSYSFFMK